jgi:hypothetical protein
MNLKEHSTTRLLALYFCLHRVDRLRALRDTSFFHRILVQFWITDHQYRPSGGRFVRNPPDLSAEVDQEASSDLAFCPGHCCSCPPWPWRTSSARPSPSTRPSSVQSPGHIWWIALYYIIYGVPFFYGGPLHRDLLYDLQLRDLQTLLLEHDRLGCRWGVYHPFNVPPPAGGS